MRDTLLAGGASAGTMAAISTSIGDLALRGLVSVIVGVITWSITQMIKKQLDKRKCKLESPDSSSPKKEP